MRLTFLGTGTSFGVPVIGCQCATCTSGDPRDHRTRHGAFLSLEGGSVLIDTPPELRLQLLRAGITRVDAVWYTHLHADHLHGIDDLRVFAVHHSQALAAYVPAGCDRTLIERFPYIFDPATGIPPGTTKPEIRLIPVDPDSLVRLAGSDFMPVVVPHGELSVFGFRTGSLGYVTDAKELPADALRTLEGVEVLVLSALWFGHPHPTHLTVEEAVEAARLVGARTTYLTHLTHEVLHRDLLESLPKGVLPAYDGLVVEIPEP